MHDGKIKCISNYRDNFYYPSYLSSTMGEIHYGLVQYMRLKNHTPFSHQLLKVYTNTHVICDNTQIELGLYYIYSIF